MSWPNDADSTIAEMGLARLEDPIRRGESMTVEQRRLMDMPLSELEALSKATCQHERMEVRHWHAFTLLPVLEGRWGIECPEPKCIRHAEHTGGHEPWRP